MKKIIPIIICIVLFLGACKTYNTSSSGKDNVSYIVVLSDNILYENSTVNVDVDGVKYIVENVYSVKNKINNEPIVITPGKHLVKVMLNDSVIVQENIFIGLQETKKIILR